MFNGVSNWAVALGAIILLLTMVGCYGTMTQIERKGKCSGRRLLTIYQIFLVILLVCTARFGIEGKLTVESMESTLSAKANEKPPWYDRGDRILAAKFNEHYFDDLCSASPADSYLLNWVDKNCPASMSLKSCAVGENRQACQTGNKCPDKKKCEEDMASCMKDKTRSNKCMSKCPYDMCRFEILEAVRDEASPLVKVLEVACVIVSVMILLTCLLICYNPQDDQKTQLMKTGVIVENNKIQEMENLEEQRLRVDSV